MAQVANWSSVGLFIVRVGEGCDFLRDSWLGLWKRYSFGERLRRRVPRCRRRRPLRPSLLEVGGNAIGFRAPACICLMLRL